MMRACTLIILGFLAVVSAQAQEEGPVRVSKEDTLVQPFSLVFAADGSAYGVEYEKGNRVFHINPEGKTKFVAGSLTEGGKKLGDVSAGDGKMGSQARFNGMHDLALHPDGRRLFLADTFNNRVRVLDLETGKVSAFAGEGGAARYGGDGGSAKKAHFAGPHTVALDPKGERLLVADLDNFRVREIDLKSGFIKTVAGNGKRGLPSDGKKALEEPLVSPRAACYAADGKGFYIASRNGHALRFVTADGRIRTVVGVDGKAGYEGDGGLGHKARLNGPKHLALDPDGNVVITDDVNHCIRLYRPEKGTIELLAGVPKKSGDKLGAGPKETELNRPHGARYDAAGRLWVADSMNHRVLRFGK